MNNVYPSPVVPLTAAGIKTVFKQYFTLGLIERGYERKQAIWVKKQGEIFIAIGTDSFCIRLFVSPFWCNDRAFDCIDYSRKGSARLGSVGNVNFPPESSPFFAPEKSFSFFEEKYLSRIDQVDSIDKYIEFSLQNDDSYSVPDYVVLYECYKRNDIEYANYFLKEARNICFQREYSSAKRRVEYSYSNMMKWEKNHPGEQLSLDMTRENWDKRFIDFYKKEKLKGKTDRAIAREAAALFDEPDPDILFEKEDLEAYLSGKTVEDLAREQARKYTEESINDRFHQLIKALKTSNFDYSKILKVIEKKKGEMRKILKQEYGLDF